MENGSTEPTNVPSLDGKGIMVLRPEQAMLMDTFIRGIHDIAVAVSKMPENKSMAFEAEHVVELHKRIIDLLNAPGTTRNMWEVLSAMEVSLYSVWQTVGTQTVGMIDRRDIEKLVP